jgi:hypothetical protein
VILALQPIIYVSLEYCYLKCDRYVKKNHSYKNHKNNHTDNIKFLEMNVGPEYPFQLKTPSLNVLLFITLVFGLAFPLLYVIAILGIILQYMVERYTLAKFYRLPPKFSLDLTFWNIGVLRAAPFCTMSIAFWMLGNR